MGFIRKDLRIIHEDKIYEGPCSMFPYEEDTIYFQSIISDKLHIYLWKESEVMIEELDRRLNNEEKDSAKYATFFSCEYFSYMHFIEPGLRERNKHPYELFIEDNIINGNEISEDKIKYFMDYYDDVSKIVGEL